MESLSVDSVYESLSLSLSLLTLSLTLSIYIYFLYRDSLSMDCLSRLSLYTLYCALSLYADTNLES